MTRLFSFSKKVSDVGHCVWASEDGLAMSGDGFFLPHTQFMFEKSYYESLYFLNTFTHQVTV